MCTPGRFYFSFFITFVNHLFSRTQAQCLSSRSQDATSPSASTPASPSSAALRKAAEVALTVEEVVEETVQVNLEEAAAAAVEGDVEKSEA